MVFLKDFSELAWGGEPAIRFSVTFATPEGKPLVTQQGYVYTKSRTLSAPRMRGKFGKFYDTTKMSDDFIAMVKLKLEGLAEVRAALGPEPERENRKLGVVEVNL